MLSSLEPRFLSSSILVNSSNLPLQYRPKSFFSNPRNIYLHHLIPLVKYDNLKSSADTEKGNLDYICDCEGPQTWNKYYSSTCNLYIF